MTVRPSTLSLPGSSSKSVDDAFDPDQGKLIAGLRAKLERQETLWMAEKATLEEFYEVNSRTLQETIGQLKDACQALRQENDGQLQLLQSSRRALSDLRNRYDLGMASWNEERDRLLASSSQVLRCLTVSNYIRHRNRNFQTSKVPLKSQERGTSIFTSVASNQMDCPMDSPWEAQFRLPEGERRHRGSAVSDLLFNCDNI